MRNELLNLQSQPEKRHRNLWKSLKMQAEKLEKNWTPIALPSERTSQTLFYPALKLGEPI